MLMLAIVPLSLLSSHIAASDATLEECGKVYLNHHDEVNRSPLQKHNSDYSIAYALMTLVVQGTSQTRRKWQ